MGEDEEGLVVGYYCFDGGWGVCGVRVVKWDPAVEERVGGGWVAVVPVVKEGLHVHFGGGVLGGVLEEGCFWISLKGEYRRWGGLILVAFGDGRR